MDDLSVYFEKALRKIIREEINQALSKYLSMDTNSKSEIEFITADEVCQFLRISKPTLYNRMKDGSINFKRLGSRVLFDKQNLFASNRQGNAQRKL